MARLDELTDPQFEEFLSALYLTMLRTGRPTREALIEAGNHPQDVDRAAAFLVSRKLITEAGPGAWDVVPPEESLNRLADVLEARARATRNTATELGALWRNASDVPQSAELVGVEVLRSADQVLLAAYSLAATAEDRLLAILDDSPVSRQVLLESVDGFARSTVPPASVSLVLDTQLLEQPGILARVEQLAATRHRVALLSGLPFSGLVVDDRAVLVDLTRHDARGDGSFVARRRAPVLAIEKLFTVMQQLSTPMQTARVKGAGEPAQAQPGDRDRRVLSLLATGGTDQQIARTVGVSTRTVERRVARLMSSLGAATRFQAGVQAARRGWL